MRIWRAGRIYLALPGGARRRCYRRREVGLRRRGEPLLHVVRRQGVWGLRGGRGFLYRLRPGPIVALAQEPGIVTIPLAVSDAPAPDSWSAVVWRVYCWEGGGGSLTDAFDGWPSADSPYSPAMLNSRRERRGGRGHQEELIAMVLLNDDVFSHRAFAANNAAACFKSPCSFLTAFFSRRRRTCASCSARD